MKQVNCIGKENETTTYIALSQITFPNTENQENNPEQATKVSLSKAQVAQYQQDLI
jgi:hypothetical protein